MFNLEGTRLHGGLAQLVEHLLCKQGVTGSSPVTSTKCSRYRAKAQRSGFGPKRRSDGARELSALGGSEGCEVRDDEGP